MIVVCSVEGFLSDGPMPDTSPIGSGLQFYRSVGKAFSWILLTEAPLPVAEAWLIREGIYGWVSLKSYNDSILETPQAWKESVISGLAASNMRPALAIESDVGAAEAISALGVPTFLNIPSMLSNETHSYLPWDQVAGMVEDRRMKHAKLKARDWNQESE